MKKIEKSFILSGRGGWILAATLPLLGGCLAFAPDYERPAPPVPGELPLEGVTSGENISEETRPGAADLGWRDFLSDSNLVRVVALALENNRDLKIATLNVERARSLYGIQRAELFPSVTASAEGVRAGSAEAFTAPGTTRTAERYDVNFGLASWEIDLFGRIRGLEEQALQTFLATGEARRGAHIALVSEVAIAYLTLAAERDNLALARATFETRRQTHDLVARQYENDIASEIDLERARTQVETARVDMARYRQRVEQARNALQLLVGAPLPLEWLPDGIEAVSSPRQIRPGLSSDVLLARPDIMAAEHRLQGTYASIGAARAAFFPRIGLTSLFGSASEDLSDLFSSGSGTWSFAPRLSLPIFDARTYAALRVSQAERDLAIGQYERAIQTAFREVADVLAVRREIGQQVAAQQSLVASAANIRALAEKRYADGIDSYLGVLDAQRSLYAARQGLVSLRLAERANRVRLYAVLGGGAGE